MPCKACAVPAHAFRFSRCLVLSPTLHAQVDIVITACTFTPVPSLSAMVASYFEMRSDVLHYSLGGQGCTSGIIEVELAAHLLRVRGAEASGCPLSVLGRAACQPGTAAASTAHGCLQPHPLLRKFTSESMCARQGRAHVPPGST